jgi:hypothetical protein
MNPEQQPQNSQEEYKHKRSQGRWTAHKNRLPGNQGMAKWLKSLQKKDIPTGEVPQAE